MSSPATTAADRRASHRRLCPPPSPLQNILAWVAAGGIAYALYVVPEKQRNEEQQVGLARQAGSALLPRVSAAPCPSPSLPPQQPLNHCCYFLLRQMMVQRVREQAKQWAVDAAAAAAAAAASGNK